MINSFKELTREILDNHGLWYGPPLVIAFGVVGLMGVIIGIPFRLIGAILKWWAYD